MEGLRKIERVKRSKRDYSLEFKLGVIDEVDEDRSMSNEALRSKMEVKSKWGRGPVIVLKGAGDGIPTERGSSFD